MYIITGLGRSGTSFLATIFTKIGYQMGVWSNELSAGYELEETTIINKHIIAGDGGENFLLKDVSERVIVTKDPRFMFTLNKWIVSGAKIDGIFYCSRDYNDILKSTSKSLAGNMGLFIGLDLEIQIEFMKSFERLFFSICDKYFIPIWKISYPESTIDYNQIKCLNNIVNDEVLLTNAWNEVNNEWNNIKGDNCEHF